MANRRFLTILAPLILFSAADPARAQERRALELAEARDIHVTRVEALSFAGLERAPDVLTRVFPMPRGGWGVSSRVFDGVVQIFDEDGRPSGTFGRAGEGPGEFKGQVFGVANGARLWIVDPGNARLSLFDSTLALIDDRPIAGRVRFAGPFGEDGTSVLVSGFVTDANATYAIARIGAVADGDVFGGEIESENARVALKVAAADDDGRVWTFANSGGAVNVLSSHDLRVRERWWLPGDEFRQEAPRRPDRTTPPVAQAVGAASGDELVWLLMAVADADWSREVNPGRDGADAYWDTAILAIDPDRKAVVARGRLEVLCHPIVDATISCVDEAGEKIDILRLEVARPDGT